MHASVDRHHTWCPSTAPTTCSARRSMIARRVHGVEVHRTGVSGSVTSKVLKDLVYDRITGHVNRPRSHSQWGMAVVSNTTGRMTPRSAIETKVSTASSFATHVLCSKHNVGDGSDVPLLRPRRLRRVPSHGPRRCGLTDPIPVTRDYVDRPTGARRREIPPTDW